MNRSKRFEPVVKIAEARERTAARMLGESLLRLKELEERLADFLRYRDEYAQKFTTVGGSGLDAALIRDYRVFLAHLSEAISQQQRAVEAARRDCETQRHSWLSARCRAEIMDKVAVHYRKQALYEQSRREQREQDEHAQRTCVPKSEC